MATVIPFVDLKQQYALHSEAIDRAVKRVCASASFILGPEVDLFEKRFASYLGAEHAVGVASGTDALHLSAQAMGIGPGDEVLIPANTFIATALAVYSIGAIPVPVDVNPETFLIEPDDACRRVTHKTRAIIPVHLYGRCVDMDAVIEFAKEYGLVIIEDACQAHGAVWNGNRAGTFGAAGCFSFYPSKNLGAFGDGGLVSTNDPQLADKLRLLRNYGSSEKYRHDFPGGNSRLDSIQAAILNVKMDFLDEWNLKRFQAACRYHEQLKDLQDIQIPVFDRDNAHRHVFHLFVIQCNRRNELLSYLNGKGIEAGIHYPAPIHLHKALGALGLRRGDFPVAESLAERILSLPMFPEISGEQIDYVSTAVAEFYGK